MTIDALFEQLKHPNPHLRERAMQELADARDENTIPRLMGILDAEDVVYRRAAVKALGAIGVDAVPPLVETLQNSDNVVVRASCTKAMAQVAVNHPDVPFPVEGMQSLKRALSDANPVVHIAAAMALGAIGAPVLDILIDALQTTENEAVAISVINALSSINDDRVIEILTTFSNDETVDSYVRESATSALSRVELVMKYKRPQA